MQSKRLFGILALAAMLLGLSACGEKTLQERISKRVNADVTAGRVLSEEDGHGGFHNDGILRVTLAFEDDRLEKSLSWNEKWRELPLPEAMGVLLEGLPEQFQPEGEMLSGYYFFQDRHSQATDRSDAAAAAQRHSINFTVAIYDCETRTLYYCEADT